MNYYIQTRCISTYTWSRDEDETPFDSPLDALERRDEIKSNWNNDGLPRGCRVVSDDGDVIEYAERCV